MNFKSLLLTGVALGAGVSAYAFPEVTAYPENEATVDNVGYLTDIQLYGSFTIVSDCDIKPYFENWDTGDMFYCSEFYDQNFDGTILHHVNFNESDFSDNGEWVLTIPSGCLLADGEYNETIEFHYNLNDPNVGLGDYPQIELISSDPANGSSLAFWGQSLGKVYFQTSDDDAVNYIEWFLYDVTNGDAEGVKEYMRQGNENRIDLNRTFGDDSDQWVDGLFISVGGPDEKLLLNHTYRLELRFCGIGYDLETNQYPTPNQVEKSTELVTYIEFHGLVPGTEYSPWEVENISPDPEVYEFDNINMRTFTIYYTGYVKPTMFIYSLGVVGTEDAGTFTPATDANVDGYAEAWDFTFDENILKGITGGITITIQAQDEDGLYVKGNGGYSTDDFDYTITWTCNLGADKIVSVSPENGETVESLSSITIMAEGNKELNLSYNTSERPMIVSMGRAGFAPIDLDEPEFSADGKSATWTFDPITTSGTYSLIIPKQYFSIGTEFSSSVNNQTVFTYIVEGEEPGPGNVEYDLIPTASIEENGNYDYLDMIVLDFDQITYCDLETYAPGYLYFKGATDSEYALIAEITPYEDDWMDPMSYTYEFTPLTEDGYYRFEIAKASFFDGVYDQTGGEQGHASPELVYNFTFGDPVGINAVMAENGVADVYDVAGRMVVRNANADQVKALNAGIYIINGKKVVVK